MAIEKPGFTEVSGAGFAPGASETAALYEDVRVRSGSLLGQLACKPEPSQPAPAIEEEPHDWRGISASAGGLRGGGWF